MRKKLRALADRYFLVRVILYPILLFVDRRRSFKKEMIANFADMLAKPPVLVIKEFGGTFQMDPRSDLFYRLLTERTYEPRLASFCKKYVDPNKDVIDIGANIGFFTVMFAGLISDRRVLAIEPTKNALNHLYANIEGNLVSDRVEVFEGVASNTNGFVEIKTIPGKEEYSSLGAMSHPSISGDAFLVENVQSTTVDQLVSERGLYPGFVKIDVEGAENLVFGGMGNLLKDVRPIILSELSNHLLSNNDSSSAEVIKLIESYGYEVFDPSMEALSPDGLDFGDIVCFPKEMNVNASKRL